jgi:cell division protein FtsI/penicillin-binding protein 2
MPAFSRLRAAVVLAVIALGLVGMIGRVAYLQTYGRQRAIRSADRQQHVVQSLPARRGSIFDAAGNALALTIQTTALYVDPHFMLEQYQRAPRRPGEMAKDLKRLAELLDQEPAKLDQVIRQNPESRYERVAENLSEEACREIQRLRLPGVGMEPAPARYYPMGSIAAHVLGTVGKDGSGLEGLELKFQNDLAGKNGWMRVEKDAWRRPIGVEAEDYIPPAHGQHLVLTLDANIQMIAEQELAAACKNHRAPRGEVIIMDPQTGDVLALANWPTFNPQNLEDSTKELRRNRSLTDPYEPGSTLKPFIMGPALGWGVTRPNEMWHIVDPYVIHGRSVTDVHHYGPLCSWDVLVKSSNIGMAMLARRMGSEKLYRSLTSFGYGKRTGLELPGEDPGLVKPVKAWTKQSTESVAQGYEMMLTPLQIARAFCVYANGGHLVTPRLIKGRLDAEGNVISRQAPAKLEQTPQVVSEETANLMRQILGDVVVRGTGTLARSQYWSIFGKTGTAHIATRHGYSHDKINASFICGAPVENPRIVVAFILHEPDRSTGRYGGSVSAPYAMRVVERTLGYMQVPTSPPLAAPPPSVASVLYNYDAKKYTLETASAHD